MIINNRNNYFPDTVSHPGLSLFYILQERKITKSQFSKLSGIKIDILNKILNGRFPINLDIAKKISKATGVDRDFWIKRQKRYDIFNSQKPTKNN